MMMNSKQPKSRALLTIMVMGALLLSTPITADDTDKMKSLMEELSKEMQALSADLYEQAKAEGEAEQAAPPPEGGASEPKPEAAEDVIDADFEMVDEEKK